MEVTGSGGFQSDGSLNGSLLDEEEKRLVDEIMVHSVKFPQGVRGYHHVGEEVWGCHSVSAVTSPGIFEPVDG